jgi:hypothetical protein
MINFSMIVASVLWLILSLFEKDPVVKEGHIIISTMFIIASLLLSGYKEIANRR